MSIDTNHGAFGSDAANFIRLVPAQPIQPTKKALAELALAMQSSPDSLNVGPDAEENLFVPAGYTYFGQFIDHDLTRDTTSTFDGVNAPTNQRTPRLDLDCVYGKGPLDQPEMYEADGATLKLGKPIDAPNPRLDLLRDASDRAIIGDPRNDENSIVSQIQAGVIRFHNKVVTKRKSAGLTGAKLFNDARNRVRWAYQRVVVEDYLARIIRRDVIQAFDADRRPNARGLSTNPAAFALYGPDNRAALPIEFAGAAYRFGHSMVRNGYLLRNDRPTDNPIPIFNGQQDETSLIGFQALIPGHLIMEWSRFFPDSSKESNTAGNTFVPAPGTAAGGAGTNNSPGDAKGAPRLQFAYRIDPSIVDPLSSLPAAVADDPPPSLIVRNLWRGVAFQLPTGQDFERALITAGKIGAGLDAKYLVVREQLDQRAANNDKQYRFVPIDAALLNSTPLWFYILAEAQQAVVDAFGASVFTETDLLNQASATGAQLGALGGRILLEVFHGLLDSDEESYRNHPDAAAWLPDLDRLRVWDIVTTA